MMRQLNTFLTVVALFFSTAVFGQEWIEVSPKPGTATDGAFAFTIDSKHYVGGGVADKNLHMYNPETNQWTQKASVPSPGNTLAWAFSFSVNGKGYVVGGSYATASDLTNKTWEYDPVGNTWKAMADFPGGQRDAGYAFAIGDKGYVGGGFEGQYLTNDLFEFNPATDKWTKLADFPGGPIIFPAAFVINGNAYVGTGGKGGSGGDEINGIWKYDPGTGNWTKKADFAGLKRQASISFTVGNKGYIGGGMTAYNEVRKDFWEYDAVSDNWRRIWNADFPTDTLAWSTVFVSGEMVYAGLGVDLPDFNFSRMFYKRSFSESSGTDDRNALSTQIKFYPVPVTNTLNLETDAEIEMQQVQIYDLQGREIKTYHESLRSLDVSDLQSGSYVVRLTTNMGELRQMILKN